MIKIALLSKNESESGSDAINWTVFQVIRFIESEDETDLVNYAKKSIENNETFSWVDISSVDNLNPKRGAAWDGSSFSDEGIDRGATVDFPKRTQRYALLSNNKLLIVFSAIPESIEDSIYKDVLLSEVKIVEILGDTIVAAGFNWNGTEFTAPLNG
jgi:hypothetical protein